MGVITEDFHRCTECGNPYFVINEVVLISKESTYSDPKVIKRVSEYKCSQCGAVEYKARE
jgi:hypothetical protein